MTTLLSTYDAKEVVAWNGVTFNTIVSIQSIVVKTTLAYAIGECLAQWKWILFSREQGSFMDFDRIDAATRGPLGCVRILTRTRSV